MIYAENIMICIAIPLLIVLFFIKDKARWFVATFLTGMVVCLLSAYYSGFIAMAGEMESTYAALYISPYVEEIMKLLPLLFCLYIFRLNDEEILLAAMGIGAGFATFENCCYILSKGADDLTYVIIRGFAVGVMHVVSVLILVLGMAIAKKYGAFSFPAVAGSLTLSITFHALYNLLVSKPGITTTLGYILPLFILIISFVPYKRTFKNIKDTEK